MPDPNDPDYRPDPDLELLEHLERYYDGIADELIWRHEEKMKKIDQAAAGEEDLKGDM